LSSAEAVQLGGQVAELTKASLPLGPGLRAMAEEFGGRRVRAALLRLADMIDAGTPLEEAVTAEWPRVPEHLRCLLEAAVRSGRFVETADEMVAIERSRGELRHRLLIIFAYPMILFVVMLLLLLMSLYIVPQFAKIYMDFGAELPALTKMMIAIFSPLGGLVMLVVIGLLVVSLPIAVSGRSRVAWMQRVLYWIPFVGPIWRFRGLAEFSRLMCLLLELKVPLPQALRAAASGVREGDVRVAARALAELVESGVPMSEALDRFPEFPATFKPLLRWGEQSAALADAFRGTADMCHGRLRVQGVFTDAALLPVILLVVLFFVGSFVMAFMLPLISLIQRLS
jgi:type II secretory pathway component PulF